MKIKSRVIAERILEVLTLQRFNDFYNGKFEDYITVEIPFSDIPADIQKRIILNEIEVLFRTDDLAKKLE